MNELAGHISIIESSGSMSIVSVKISDSLSLKSIIIETPETADYLVVGRKIRLMFKENEVVIGSLTDHPISLQNRIKGSVKSLEKGRLLSRVHISSEVGELQSVISTESAERLGLKEGLGVYAMVKLNEMMLAE